jgi:hypothetical protein
LSIDLVIILLLIFSSIVLILIIFLLVLVKGLHLLMTIHIVSLIVLFWVFVFLQQVLLNFLSVKKPLILREQDVFIKRARLLRWVKVLPLILRYTKGFRHLLILVGFMRLPHYLLIVFLRHPPLKVIITHTVWGFIFIVSSLQKLIHMETRWTYL